ncbi:hypothetical protein Bca4012_100862 [Brassica carinata]
MKAIVISSQERQRPKSCLGTIESIVMSVTRRKVGNQDWCEYADQCSFHVLFDRTTEIVCVLLSGGGYAKKVVETIGQILPIPHV